MVIVGEGRERFGHVFMTETGTSVGEISGQSKPINSCDFRPARPFRIITGRSLSISLCKRFTNWYHIPMQVPRTIQSASSKVLRSNLRKPNKNTPDSFKPFDIHRVDTYSLLPVSMAKFSSTTVQHLIWLVKWVVRLIRVAFMVLHGNRMVLSCSPVRVIKRAVYGMSKLVNLLRNLLWVTLWTINKFPVCGKEIIYCPCPYPVSSTTWM